MLYSPLGGRFYATRAWRQNKDGTIVVTGEKTDVTNDIGAAINEFDIEFVKAKDEEGGDAQWGQ